MVPAAVVGQVFFGIAAGGTLTAGVYIATIVVNLAISAILGKVLAPDVPASGVDTKGLQNVIRNNVTPRRVCYGEAIVGGPYAVLETIGLDNETLSMVVVLTAHPIEDLLGVFIDDEYVDVSGTDNSSNDLDSLYWVESGKYGTNEAVEHVKIIKNNGWGYADNKYVTNSGGSDAVLDRTRGDLIENYLNTVWTQPATTARDSGTGIYTDTGYKLTNCAHVFLSFKFNPDVWSGYPQIRFHIKGKRLYNPARDSNFTAEGAAESPLNHTLADPDTYEWSDDWTLACIDYMLNPSYGLGAKVTGVLTEVDWEAAIQAYYDSSEIVTNGFDSPNTETAPRYTTNGAFEVSSTPISIMESLLNSGAGQLIYAQGKYKLKAGVYKIPDSDNDIINEDMIVSPMTIQTHTSRNAIFNKAAGVFVDIGYDRASAPSNTNKPLFEPTDFPIVDPLDSSGLNPYEVIDGEEIIKEFDFPFTIHSYEAQRLARIQLERIRKGLSVSFEANLKVLKYSVGDTIYLEILNNSKYASEAFYNRLGLDNQVQTQEPPRTTPYYKQFKIVDMQYTENFTIAVTLIEEDEQIYEWNDGDANLIEHALISEIVFDDPTGEIIKPNFYSNSIFDNVSWPNSTTFIYWDAPSRGSQLNALDRAQIRSYILEYGNVADPSEPEYANRVSTWIKGGSFTVTDPSVTVQGPINIQNLFLEDGQYFDFRIRAVLYNGRKSNWAYYSEDVGSDYLPNRPGTSRFGVPVAGQKTLHYNKQITSFLTGSGTTSAGEFGIKDDSSDFTPFYPQITSFYFNMRGSDNSAENITFFNQLRNGDVVTFFVSEYRWWKFRLNHTSNPFSIVSSTTSDDPDVTAKISGLEVIDWKDTDPLNNTLIDYSVSPYTTESVEFRFEKDSTNIAKEDLLDLNFDKSTEIAIDATYWRPFFDAGPDSPDITELVEGGGEDGSNALYLTCNPVVASNSSNHITSQFYFRTPNVPLAITLRYQSISGTNENPNWGDFGFAVRPDKWPHARGDTPSQSTWKQAKFSLKATGSGNWDSVTAVLPPSEAKYSKFAFVGLSQQAAESAVYDILIDSINIVPVDLKRQFESVLVSNTVYCNLNSSLTHFVDLTPATGNVTINIISPYLESDEAVEVNIKIQQDTSPRTATWQFNSSATPIKWAGGTAPTLSSGSGAIDLFTFKTQDGGTTWIGSAIQNIS